MVNIKNIITTIILMLVIQCFYVNYTASGEPENEKKNFFLRSESSEINYEHFFEGKKHWCNTMVINCSDFRFARAAQELINEKLGFKGDYDYFSIPGSIRNMLNKETRKLVMDTFGISVRLHHVKRIVIIAHEDCIGYGGEEAFSDHEEEYNRIVQDMKKARRLMRFRFHDLSIYLFYGRIIDDNEVKKFEYEQIL
ncbi:MAG: hypothetical protein E3K37_08275 [Candidatus Kuenenia sp.]|nr:hypothetical protein [Candidatus Kuenenia hertensis]